MQTRNQVGRSLKAGESDNTRTAPAVLGAFGAGRLEPMFVEERRSYGLIESPYLSR